MWIFLQNTLDLDADLPVRIRRMGYRIESEDGAMGLYSLPNLLIPQGGILKRIY